MPKNHEHVSPTPSAPHLCLAHHCSMPLPRSGACSLTVCRPVQALQEVQTTPHTQGPPPPPPPTPSAWVHPEFLEKRCNARKRFTVCVKGKGGCERSFGPTEPSLPKGIGHPGHALGIHNIRWMILPALKQGLLRMKWLGSILGVVRRNVLFLHVSQCKSSRT